MTTTVFPRRSNLPAEVSSFVGRRQELAQLRAALGSHRLVTLLGPGGVGKTRLALRAARDRSKLQADGPWLVELAPLQDPDLIVDTVLAALGLRDSAGGPPIERLVSHLGEREILLVLDNCEHVNDAAASLATELLDSCRGLQVLATTRHTLGVPGEHVLQVAPLRVPTSGPYSGAPEGLLRYDAVRLFAERAAASFPSFRVTSANQEAVVDLVRRLDGVPLAIELASVRVRVLSPQQILERLSDRFGLLSQGDRTAMERQQNLRALIDWSHDLLSEPEQQLWSRASVFAGSFDLEAVEHVCGAGAADLVEGLVSKSILERDEIGGLHRFRMLQSLQEYGAARLDESGEGQAYVERHRDYYGGLAARAAAEMYGPDEVTWFRRLVADHDNVRAALEDRAAHPEGAPAGLRIASQLQHYWVMTGRFHEGRYWLDRFLVHVDEPVLERAAGLEVAGRLAVLQADVDAGLPLLEEARRLATVLDDPTWQAHAAHGLAIAAIFWGEAARAVSLLDEALALHREGGDPFGAPLALVQLATVHAILGDPARAIACAEECIALSEVAGEPWCAALGRWTQALIEWQRGQPSRARTHAQEALKLKQPFGDRMGMAMAMEIIAWVAAKDRRYDEAAQLLGAVAAAMRSVGAELFRHLLDDHDRCVQGCLDALGERRFQEEFDAGAARSFDESVGRALGRRTPAPTGARPEAVVRLTKREHQIAELVADGLSNREVAERLVISLRTAEGHVDRIMRKLGFSGRAQIAAWVVEQRPRR